MSQKQQLPLLGKKDTTQGWSSEGMISIPTARHPIEFRGGFWVQQISGMWNNKEWSTQMILPER